MSNDSLIVAFNRTVLLDQYWYLIILVNWNINKLNIAIVCDL